MTPRNPNATVEIIVRLSAEASDPAGAPTAGVLRTAADVGATLKPLHPGTSDPDLVRYAAVRVPRSQADRVLARLMSSSGVDAAYIKPTGEAP